MIPRPKELASLPGPKGANQALEMSQGFEFWEAGAEKSGTPKHAAQPQEIDHALADQATFPVLHTNRR